ncbi:uncharacterized protein LOC143627679 [Bidens hawaiensis]|uniref:uncharacterized protein LOC143627679 n=1 Tax=Bidens hawaiensis TaxID=980011 RepID=UPI00404917C8
MERRIDPVAPLDYVELQIFPSHNRYEACVSTSNIIEKAATGDLQQLLLHLPQVKDLSSKTNDSKFRILTPDGVSNADWFTTVTLTRFLNIAGSPDILSIGNEITQLEETRKFQLSLFAKAEVDMTSSFESKNELLRAVDSRLSELKQQFGEALNQATGITCSPKDLSNLENFAHHFGAEDIRDSLQKFLVISQFPSSKDSTPEKTVLATHTSQLNPPVKYGVSPAKAAQVERQSSTDSENTFSSEEEEDEDQPSVERSRPVARSATPRRLASPMRRVQIGRAGPHRAATISIKSLNYFPNREKLSTQKDATSHASDEEEDSETPAKQNALRMSVQDKISLFENKQKEKAVETEKSKTVLTAPVANKAVLRRWSSGMSESAATQIQNDTINKTSSSSNRDDGAPGGNTESLTSQSSETAKNIKSSPPKKAKADILNLEMENSEDESEEVYEKHPASIEWNQQKEAELNQLFKKMMESKPVRRHSVTNDNGKSKNNNSKEQRGGFYDHYKQKRDEKLRKEASGKKAEKESQFKEMEKFLDEKKAEMASTNITDSRKKPIVNKIKPQNSQKNPTQLLNTKKETSKGPIAKKSTTSTTNKLSPLPATRKSWPATPSPRPAGSSPAKTPSGPVSTNASLTRKPQTTSSTLRSSTKVEKSKLQPKTLKSTPPDGTKNIKTVKEKKQPTVTKSAPAAKSKSRTQATTPNAATSTATTAAATTAKPSFYNKVTKKSSVVPLETKPFLRKGTGIGPGVGPVVVKSKVVAQPEEQQPDNTGDMIQSEDNNNQAVEVEATEITSQSQNQEMECEPTESFTESEAQLLTPIKREEPEGFIHSRFNKTGNEGIKKKEIEEESTISISPTAWVEIEENNNNNQDEIVPCKESPVQVPGPANPGAPAGASSPRVRHSLFQMLLEETTSEADSCEWGNAQQPPAMVNQKDGPKGFKRLLKFARKSKADLNLSDGSSPSSIFRRG